MGALGVVGESVVKVFVCITPNGYEGRTFLCSITDAYGLGFFED